MSNEKSDTELTEEIQSNLPISNENEGNLISDESLLKIYDEIMDNIRNDRKQLDSFIDNFAESVINGGDSATSSKEALVNLVKIKADSADKITRVADLMTRLKMKQPDTYKPYLGKKDAAGHTINIYDQGGLNKKALFAELSKEDKKKKNGN